MAGTSRGSWQTVDDEEARAWRATMADQRARNDAQAAAAERKYWARRAEGAASVAGDSIDAAQIGAAIHAGISKNPTAERIARGLKTLGRASPVLSGVGSTASYVADRHKGMPADEALVRNGADFGLGLAGGAIGGALGSFVAPGPGTAIGGVSGAGFGASWSDEVGDAYVHAKRAAQRTAQPFTDPRYVMRALRSR